MEWHNRGTTVVEAGDWCIKWNEVEEEEEEEEWCIKWNEAFSKLSLAKLGVL